MILVPQSGGHVLKHSEDKNMPNNIMTNYVIMLAGLVDHFKLVHLAVMDKILYRIKVTDETKFVF